MRKIAIVGGGQSGLQLALGLLQGGYQVTVISNRTPEQIRKGRVTSSQFMFHDSLQNDLYEVLLDEDIRLKALVAIQRMMSIQ